MKLSSGELISYLRIHFKIYSHVNLVMLSRHLNITINEYKLCDSGHVISITLTENHSGSVIKW